MHVLEKIKIKFMGKEVECEALFDIGSNYTIIQRKFFEKHFGKSWIKLPREVKLYLINGEVLKCDKYVEIMIVIDDFELLPPETVLVLDDFVKEIEVNGRKVKLPELIIGSGTMDKYGIILDPKEGIKVVGATLLI